MSGFTPYTPNPALAVQVSNFPLAGVALINGTQTFLSWTTPNDGAVHRIMINADVLVTTLETGGAVSFTYTLPNGSVQTGTLNAGGQAAGNLGLFAMRLVAPNTTVTVQQSTALTAGAAVFWGEIWGA